MIVVDEVEWKDQPTILKRHEVYLKTQVRQRTEEKLKIFDQTGMPSDWREQLKQFESNLSEKAELLVCGVPNLSPKWTEPYYRLLDGLTTAIAILAFCPGGVTIFGTHYEVRRDGITET